MRMDISVHLRNSSNRLQPMSATSQPPAKHRPRLIIDLSLITNESGGSRKEKKEKRVGRLGGGGRMLTSCPRCQTTFVCGGGVSPSAPLVAHFPALPGVPQEAAATPSPEADLERLRLTMGRLEDSGWYHGGLTWREAITLLSACSPGTFLVRDSADPGFLLSLSVQTENGPKSIRLHYADGYFRMAAEPGLVSAMPRFDCAVKLVEYYVALSAAKDSRTQVWVDCVTGAVHADIVLRRGLQRAGRLPSLQHLARLAVNKLPSRAVPSASLPQTLLHYLAQYPYTH